MAAALVKEYFEQRRGLRDCGRVLRCVVMSEPGIEAHQVARRLYPDHPGLEVAVRAAVAPADRGEHPELVGTSSASAAFVAAIREREILSRLPGVIRGVPFNVPLAFISASTQHDFVGESMAIAASAAAFGQIQLPRTKIAGLVAVSNLLLEHAPLAESVLARDTIAGQVAASDRRLLNPASDAVARERPAAITFDAFEVDASGVVDAAGVRAVLADLIGALQAAGSTLLFGAFVIAPAGALALSLLLDELGGRAFDTVTVTGGTLAGLPLLVSASAPEDTLILVDGSQLLVADSDQVEITASTAASILMDDDPSMPAQLTSMFQSESSAIKTVRYVSWRMLRPGFVAYASNFAPPVPTTESA